MRSPCRYSIALFLVMCWLGVIPVHAVQSVTCQKIQTEVKDEKTSEIIVIPQGPEDLVLDKWNNPPRLLVSSYDRRKKPDTGEIYSIDLEARRITRMHRAKEPPYLAKAFKPHGVDILRLRDDTTTLLYVIVHDVKVEDEVRQEVVQYKVLPDSLEYQRSYFHSLLVAPNDLTATPEGNIFVANDASTNTKLIKYTEMLFSLKSSSVVKCVAPDSCSVAAKDIALANGMISYKTHVIVTASRDNELFLFPASDMNLQEKQVKPLAQLTGPDNITRFDPDNPGSDLLVAAHVEPVAFFLHGLSSFFHSPSSVYRVKAEQIDKAIAGSDGSDQADPKRMFYDDGNVVSAVSTAVAYNNMLYLGQVFDPFVLAVPFTGEEATCSAVTSTMRSVAK